ncbi:IQ domain-containing protein K [Lingula anatina]|uniref:IQ domain-containing protein K n=1 Tax=Lingula anatina TaxID=7574 RepID=A0A1S3H1Y5_LINAN|nr:IQ domain-containing protein K [Lingula anatina]|eukprot:XP_013379952.1 IQ domain-containing protein K [Lingula anatina]
MSVITRVPEPNIWEEICKEFAAMRPPFKEDDTESTHTEYRNYDPSKVTPVFYGKMHHKMQGTQDVDLMKEFDASKSHPATVGYAFVDKPPRTATPPPPAPPDKKTCPPREYLEHYVFPVLLPALEEMLKQAKKEKCFERRRTKFNAIDYLTEYLYRKNPEHLKERSELGLLDIPFVQQWLKEHPRPPLPMSLLWSEEEAAIVLQSGWRGYLVRRVPEIQELRQWQREWREENADVKEKVMNFWASKMPNGDQPTPNVSVEQLTDESLRISVSSPAALEKK